VSTLVPLSATVRDHSPAGLWAALVREASFLARDRAALLVLGTLCLLATTSVSLGLIELARQDAAIERFRSLDAADRRAALEGVNDWGDAAYAAFHATWQSPSPLSFAALGQRDVSPYMLRVRMLALEGQIHEADTGNPELALTGRFDLAFVVAFLAPIALVLLLHDVVSHERESGRMTLLVATAGDARRLWASRFLVRIAAVTAVILLPFGCAAMAASVPPGAALLAAGAILASIAAWSLLLVPLAFRPWASTVIATAGVGLWVLLALLVPLAGRALVDASVPRVEGSDIALLQREAVNDAWDLPKSVTMERFFESHPQWARTRPIDAPFDWRWYYAFQQVGDEAAAALSQRYRASIAARDRWAGVLAWFSPSVAVQRALQHLANTDVAATLRYDARIRAYHASLRRFWYPLLFEEQLFDRGQLDRLPEFATGVD
jgi:ABC-2 type transport system permease protein